MIRRPPGSTRTDTPFPSTTLCRSKLNMQLREFLSTAALGGLAVTLPVPVFAADTAGLPNLAAKAVPNGKDERMARIAKAKELMRANDIGAMLIEPGSRRIHLTGVDWWCSERLTAAVLTREGAIEIGRAHACTATPKATL